MKPNLPSKDKDGDRISAAARLTPVLALSLPLLVAILTWVAQSRLVSAEKTDTADNAPASKPIRALMITGGCCHDYENQKHIISVGIDTRTSVEWTIIHEGGDARDHRVSVYENPDWPKGYDVIVHNECFGDIEDDDFIRSIAEAHDKHGVGAVMLHCSMHSYRLAKHDEWRKLLGVSSFNHGKKNPIAVRQLEPDHPVLKGLPENYVTPQGELYNIVKLWPTATALAQGTTESTPNPQVCIWVNQYGRSRVFGTTIGHHNETMEDPTYLDLLTRGMLFAADRL